MTTDLCAFNGHDFDPEFRCRRCGEVRDLRWPAGPVLGRVESASQDSATVRLLPRPCPYCGTDQAALGLQGYFGHACPNKPPSPSVVSVDCERSKWSSLTLTHSDGRTEEVPFPDMGDYQRLGSPYVDHVPNPRHVCRWAEKMGYEIDETALERMVGRWELEATDHYAELWE